MHGVRLGCWPRPSPRLPILTLQWLQEAKATEEAHTTPQKTPTGMAKKNRSTTCCPNPVQRPEYIPMTSSQNPQSQVRSGKPCLMMWEWGPIDGWKMAQMYSQDQPTWSSTAIRCIWIQLTGTYMMNLRKLMILLTATPRGSRNRITGIMNQLKIKKQWSKKLCMYDFYSNLKTFI